MRFIISGGGTGGHIYPAIAIANELKALHPNSEILFVGAKGRMEMEKVPQAGYPIEGLWISGIQRKLTLKNLAFPFKVISSILEARKIILRFKPDAVIGVGGYASGPLLYAATQLKIPALIQEQNSYAGLTNKWLAKKVQKICVAYPHMERFFPAQKIVSTGNPVRGDILDLKDKREQALDFFKLNPQKKTILVVGGSQGSRSINEAISHNLSKFIEKDIQLIWQTGKNSFSEAPDSQLLLENPLLHRTEFIYKMDLGYAAADVVISRAGALAVSELCIAAKPTVFVPLPSAAEDHQTKNAESLAQQNAAWLVSDTQARNEVVEKAISLLEDEALSKTFSENIQKLAKPNATRQIAEEVLKLVRC
jgi:UDP-N-acetylglucosamine--N-acetylmuramyl-(pentapeptide) pyrophosphoryl-undecaprenol N-acetylglucosamine transferase